MKRLMIIGLWPDDAVNYCTEKCDCRRYAFDRKMKQEYDGSVRNPYCRRWTHRAIVRSFKKKFR